MVLTRHIIFFFTVLLLFSCQRDREEGIDLTHIAYQPEPYELEVPFFLPPMPPTPNNPLTKEGVLLGRMLFYDPILSRDSTISCESCHKQQLAFTDGLAKSVGIGGRMVNRSSMSIVNLAWANNGLFWDGRVKTLEELSLHPIEDPNEMDEKLPNLVKKLSNHSLYQAQFRKAFGITNTSQITPELIGKALAQFQRIIISGDSKFDRHLWYQTEFLDDDEYDGYLMLFLEDTRVFDDAECNHCHTPDRLFTSNMFNHNGIIGVQEGLINPGLGGINRNQSDVGKFRVPTLRNIAVTGPYMHDGRIKTLEEVLDHYFSGGVPHPNRDPLIQSSGQANFTPNQRQMMVKFLHTLTDSTLLTNPAYSNPFKK
jgi:cytochrome c peroxidase